MKKKKMMRMMMMVMMMMVSRATSTGSQPTTTASKCELALATRACTRPFCCSTGVTPAVQANRPDFNDCPADQLEAAKATCKEKEHKYFPSMACFTD